MSEKPTNPSPPSRRNGQPSSPRHADREPEELSGRSLLLIVISIFVLPVLIVWYGLHPHQLVEAWLTEHPSIVDETLAGSAEHLRRTDGAIPTTLVEIELTASGDIWLDGRRHPANVAAQAVRAVHRGAPELVSVKVAPDVETVTIETFLSALREADAARDVTFWRAP